MVLHVCCGVLCCNVLVCVGLTGNSTAGLGLNGYSFPSDVNTVATWVTPAVQTGSKTLMFQVKAPTGYTLALMRLSEIQLETYTVYFNVTTATV